MRTLLMINPESYADRVTADWAWAVISTLTVFSLTAVAVLLVFVGLSMLVERLTQPDRAIHPKANPVSRIRLVLMGPDLISWDMIQAVTDWEVETRAALEALQARARQHNADLTIPGVRYVVEFDTDEGNTL